MFCRSFFVPFSFLFLALYCRSFYLRFWWPFGIFKLFLIQNDTFTFQIENVSSYIYRLFVHDKLLRMLLPIVLSISFYDLRLPVTFWYLQTFLNIERHMELQIEYINLYIYSIVCAWQIISYTCPPSM
jgi:hypothetical protein